MKQKKTIKQVLCMVLIICCTVTSFNVSMVQTQAATDVTDSETVQKDIKKIAKFFKTVCGCDLVYKMKIGQTKKYDCSKESVRRYIINGSCASGEGMSYFHNISANTLSKHFFGKGTSKTKLIGSDMGSGEFPEFKIEKISRLSSGKYKAIININQFSANFNTRFRTGKLTMILKKKPKSYYGYIVKSLSLKKIGDIGVFSNWKSAYKSMLKYPNDVVLANYSDFNSDFSWLREMGYADGFDRYFLCDVDNNKIPELFMRTNGEHLTAVFTYRNGEMTYLGYNDFYKINKSRKSLIVKGHWHGAGGSGADEYHIYGIGKKELKPIYSIDHIYGRYNVYGKGVKSESVTSETYDKVYNKYVKGGKEYKAFKKYKLSDMKGLKVQ